MDVSHIASDEAAAVGTDKGLGIPNSCLQRAPEPATSMLVLQSKRSSLPHCKTLGFWTPCNSQEPMSLDIPAASHAHYTSRYF